MTFCFILGNGRLASRIKLNCLSRNLLEIREVECLQRTLSLDKIFCFQSILLYKKRGINQLFKIVLKNLRENMPMVEQVKENFLFCLDHPKP